MSATNRAVPNPLSTASTAFFIILGVAIEFILFVYYSHASFYLLIAKIHMIGIVVSAILIGTWKTTSNIFRYLIYGCCVYTMTYGATFITLNDYFNYLTK